jgi:protein phosphatase 4 regulatory subunit 3
MRTDCEFHPVNDLTFQEVSLYSHLVDILTFFVRQHLFRSRNFMHAESLAPRVAQLLTVPQKHLKLSKFGAADSAPNFVTDELAAALKFFRTLISLQDTFYHVQMTHNNTFELILNIVYETMPRDNLLNSACLELFEFVKRENIKPIIIHVVEKYRDKLKDITYVDTFQNLILRYDQMQGYGAEPDTTLFNRDDSTTPTRHLINGGQRWQGVREMDASEEEYFDTSDDEEDEVGILSNGAMTNNVVKRRVGLIMQHQQGKRTNETAVASNGLASPLVKPLVDYPDDDDDVMDVHPQEQQSQQQQQKSDLLRDKGGQSPAEDIPTLRGTMSSASSVAGQRPLERYSEKRRRSEEDDDDELVKLSSGPKRRTSSVSAGSGSVSFLRRKKSFTASSPAAAEKKNDQLSSSPGTTTGSSGRKIAINLSMSSTLKVTPNQNHTAMINTDKESKSDGSIGGNRNEDRGDDGGGG